MAAVRSSSERQRHTWVHMDLPAKSLAAPTNSLGAPAKMLGVPTSSLGAPEFPVEQSEKHNIFIGIAAGAAGNLSYYLSFYNC